MNAPTFASAIANGKRRAGSVADLLADSKVFHLAYREALAGKRIADAAAALQQAAEARASAELADPNHTDPAWQNDASTHVNGAQTNSDANDDLLRFYAQKLNRG